MDSPSPEYIEEWFGKRRSKATIIRMVRKFKNDENFLLQLTTLLKNKDPDYSARVSWVMRAWIWRNKKIASKYLYDLLLIAEANDNDSIIRNLSGIFIDTGVPVSLEGSMANFCFRLMEEKQRAPGVHANALALLLPISKKYPELKEEVKMICENHPNSSMASFQVRVKKFNFAGRKISSEKYF